MTITPIAKDPADVFGYTTAFEEALKKVGQISPQEFAQRYASSANYLPQMSFDPTTAKFWEDFYKNHRFQLNAEELAIFKQNGFVVSERLGAENFTELFYRIYNNDLPVFVSADALLHAWHRSYDAILEELEETYLFNLLDEILQGMQEKIPNTWHLCGNGILAESIKDVDYFLAVARSLLAEQTVATYLNQDSRVTETLQAIQRTQLQEFKLFGRFRQVDFSQFKVRGHYENSPLLKRYFRAMMWCGRIDLRIAGTLNDSSSQELGAAVIFYHVLQQSDKFEQWQQFDKLLQTFVGRTDSMTFAQLGDILSQVKIKSPADVKNWEIFLELEANILNNKIGVQHIRSHHYKSPLGTKKIKLPRSFSVIGQKFVIDSWVTSKVVYDDIEWNGEKVQRRVPSCLDVAFAALGNNQVVPELVARMTDTQGRKFRDGLNYQHNLAALKDVIDEQNPAVWEENIYMSWLATLRELSAPTTDCKYPEAMRNRAWSMKTLNTQLASWTQLRHDTILYVKQSYTGMMACYYPAGFVEPRPTFWEGFEKMALLAANLIESIPLPKRSVEKDEGSRYKYKTSLQDIQKKHIQFFKNFAQKLATLKNIAQKELAQEEFTQEESKFLEDIVEINRGSGGDYSYNGWYPKLFYKGIRDCEKQDLIVADVHTDLPDDNAGDPGCVLHQGIGNVDLLMVAVDNGKDKVVYAGPVLSHYEFEVPAVSRKSDSDWRCDLEVGNIPPRPKWTRSYLLPKRHFSKFANLTSLDLSSKQLMALPKDICRLTHLTSLDLSGNQLIALPPEIGQLTNLRELNLRGNKIGVLPSEIGQLKSLTQLNLSSNQLAALPSEISQLKNLTQLNLGDNQLTLLPPQIGQLTNLTQLNIRYNQLTALPPEIGQLIDLTELQVEGNQLAALPSEIGHLTKLTKLDLSNQKLTKLPPEIGKLINLTELNLSNLGNQNNNQLTELPSEIGQLSNLEVLELSGNCLTVLPPEIGKLIKLTRLDIKQNNLTSLPPEIGNLTNLTWLDLRKNQLVKLPPEIGKIVNLKLLLLHNNQLTELPSEIGQISQLKLLQLCCNQLTALPPEIIQLTNLRTLHLHNNPQLTVLPSKIAQFTNLEQLRISQVKLSASLNEVSQLPNLTEISYNNTPVKELLYCSLLCDKVYELARITQHNKDKI